jgi:hypothetical protein
VAGRKNRGYRPHGTLREGPAHRNEGGTAPDIGEWATCRGNAVIPADVALGVAMVTVRMDVYTNVYTTWHRICMQLIDA